MVLESCRDHPVPTLGQRIHDGLSNLHDRAEPRNRSLSEATMTIRSFRPVPG